MYTDVVVLTYQSPDINHFTYLVPKNLEKEIKVGQLVQVPFGNRTPMGVIIATSHQRPETSYLKPISSIILKHPILLPYQVELLKWMSFYYLAPMVNCLNAILPELPRRSLIVDSSSGTFAKGQALAELIPWQRPGLKLINQTLVLVPTINRIAQTLARFASEARRAQFPKAKNHVLYHNELKPTEKFATYRRILDGGADYIFGSRSAIFAPCPSLAKIIIFDEHDHAYKDERSPYFDTLTVAQKISQLTNAKIQIIDSAPKISTYFSLPQNIKLTKEKTNYQIVSMQQERAMQNFGPISNFLLSSLKKNVAEGKNSLLFLNKKKESGALFCKSCKSHTYLEKQPETCPNCGSSDFYFNILNISSLAKEIQKQIPTAKIKLISDRTGDWKLETGNSIDIATAQVFYAPLVKKYDLVAHVAPDVLINRADFSSSEALYEQIAALKALLRAKNSSFQAGDEASSLTRLATFDVANLSARKREPRPLGRGNLLKKDGALILQTHDPENSTIKSAAAGDYPSYYNEQLKLRRALSYPPFALLVKLTVKGKDKQKIHQKAEGLITKLRTAIQPSNPSRLGQSGADHPNIQLLGPYTPVFFSKNAIYNIIIKYKLGSYLLEEREKAIKNLQFLRKLKDTQITVDPESIN